MTVRAFTFNPFQTNAYVCDHNGEAVLIDPSSMTPPEHQQILAYLDKNDLMVTHLLLTHGHLDHIFGCQFFAEHFGIGWQMHRADLPLIEHAPLQAEAYGMPLDAPPRPTAFLSAEDTLTIGGTTWRVLHTPGHSPGSISFFGAEHEVLIAGDVLFRGSIGRTDLWQGDQGVLMQSIYQTLLPLGEGVTVYPGHGGTTTLGEEAQTNPFLVS
ncbi:MAG: MBL fold metallo-hydrolase [Rhodothermales bacterium]